MYLDDRAASPYGEAETLWWKQLRSNFVIDEDYKVTVLPREHGKFTDETIMLNVDTFKNLCMIAKTEKGKSIRKYYVKLENIYNKLIGEEGFDHVFRWSSCSP